jgi:hypothetical protein
MSSYPAASFAGAGFSAAFGGRAAFGAPGVEVVELLDRRDVQLVAVVELLGQSRLDEPGRVFLRHAVVDAAFEQVRERREVLRTRRANHVERGSHVETSGESDEVTHAPAARRPPRNS